MSSSSGSDTEEGKVLENQRERKTIKRRPTRRSKMVSEGGSGLNFAEELLRVSTDTVTSNFNPNVNMTSRLFVLGSTSSTTSNSKKSTRKPNVASSVLKQHPESKGFDYLFIPPSTTTTSNEVSSDQQSQSNNTLLQSSNTQAKEENSLYSFLKLSSAAGIKTKIAEMVLKQKKRKVQIISYERDLISDREDVKVYAFKPFLKVVAPNFCKNIICNNTLLTRLNRKELETLNAFIGLIYSREPFRDFKLFQSVQFLIFLMDVSKEDFIKHNKIILSQFTFEHLHEGNTMDILVDIDRYISWRKELLEENNSNGFLNECRTSCLEFIGIRSSSKEFDYNEDPRVKDYVLEFYRNKDITCEQIEAVPSPFVLGGINLLHNKKEDSDVVVRFANTEHIRTVYCHKTILSSISEILEVSFGPNWSNEEDEDGRAILDIEHLQEIAADPLVMEHIIDYAYGIFSPIKVSAKHVIPLIKASHLYRIQGLIDECLYLCLNKDKLSYFEVAESLEDHFQDETMQAFEDLLAEIGTSSNSQFILGASDEEIMRLPKSLLIKIFRKLYRNFQQK